MASEGTSKKGDSENILRKGSIKLGCIPLPSNFCKDHIHLNVRIMVLKPFMTNCFNPLLQGKRWVSSNH